MTDELRELSEAATPGPWEAEGRVVLTRPTDEQVNRWFGSPPPKPVAQLPPARTVVAEGTRGHNDQDAADAVFIAAAANYVRAALAATPEPTLDETILQEMVARPLTSAYFEDYHAGRLDAEQVARALAGD